MSTPPQSQHDTVSRDVEYGLLLANLPLTRDRHEQNRILDRMLELKEAQSA